MSSFQLRLKLAYSKKLPYACAQTKTLSPASPSTKNTLTPGTPGLTASLHNSITPGVTLFAPITIIATYQSYYCRSLHKSVYAKWDFTKCCEHGRAVLVHALFFTSRAAKYHRSQGSIGLGAPNIQPVYESKLVDRQACLHKQTSVWSTAGFEPNITDVDMSHTLDSRPYLSFPPLSACLEDILAYAVLQGSVPKPSNQERLSPAASDPGMRGCALTISTPTRYWMIVAWCQQAVLRVWAHGCQELDPPRASRIVRWSMVWEPHHDRNGVPVRR
ncbi:hypothetical protein GGX14DRAFT_624696 [Mycena pura]|uniref:Uncharacterized protein n=1 Tax=Mycena pura TaxID=153505 RepID=A0AAD6VGP3_9AGAR|nr:hypothetical protein GGX14DRAFT_624696 [Mycena pura]